MERNLTNLLGSSGSDDILVSHSLLLSCKPGLAAHLRGPVFPMGAQYLCNLCNIGAPPMLPYGGGDDGDLEEICVIVVL